ncbi:hypothetical protein GW17_00027511 [Ensete ventricosum]|nr:hypothetical protein GW17_00027511 [Ensete ventricosum]
MTGSIELKLDNGPRSSLGIGPGSDDAVGSRQEFARRFAERIGKLVRNMKGDRRKKTKGLIARMQEATELVEVGSKLSLWSLKGTTFTENPTGKPPVVVGPLVPHNPGGGQQLSIGFDRHPKKIGCGSRCTSRRRTREWT